MRLRGGGPSIGDANEQLRGVLYLRGGALDIDSMLEATKDPEALAELDEELEALREAYADPSAEQERSDDDDDDEPHIGGV